MSGQVKYLSTLPEIRRALTYIKAQNKTSTKTLATLRRAIAVSRRPKMEASFTTRTTMSKEDRERQQKIEEDFAKEQQEAQKISPKDLKTLTDITLQIEESRKQSEAASNIKSLLESYFNVEDNNIAARMLKLADSLHSKSVDLLNESVDASTEMSNKYVTKPFKSFVNSIKLGLSSKIKESYQKIGADNFPEPNVFYQTSFGRFDKLNALITTAYFEFIDIEINGVTQDYFLTITSAVPISNVAPSKSSVADMTQNYWARSLTSYQPPTWLANNFAGVKIDKKFSPTILRTLYLMMQSENLIHTADPSPSPLNIKKLNSILPDELKNYVEVSRTRDSDTGSYATKGMIRLVYNNVDELDLEDYRQKVKESIPALREAIIMNTVGSRTKPNITVYKANSGDKPIFGFKIVFTTSDDMATNPNISAQNMKDIASILNIKDKDTLSEIVYTLKDKLGIINDSSRRAMTSFIKNKLKHLTETDESEKSKAPSPVDPRKASKDAEELKVINVMVNKFNKTTTDKIPYFTDIDEAKEWRKDYEDSLEETKAPKVDEEPSQDDVENTEEEPDPSDEENTDEDSGEDPDLSDEENSDEDVGRSLNVSKKNTNTQSVKPKSNKIIDDEDATSEPATPKRGKSVREKILEEKTKETTKAPAKNSKKIPGKICDDHR